MRLKIKVDLGKKAKRPDVILEINNNENNKKTYKLKDNEMTPT